MANDEESKARELLDNLRADKYPLPDEKFRFIGNRDVRRLDGREKASGLANYTMDVKLPGMLYMRILTCPFPHAKILRMDTSRAESLPGVRAVLRYDDPDMQIREDCGGHGLSPRYPLPGVAHFQGGMWCHHRSRHGRDRRRRDQARRSGMGRAPLQPGPGRGS